MPVISTFAPDATALRLSDIIFRTTQGSFAPLATAGLRDGIPLGFGKVPKE